MAHGKCHQHIREGLECGLSEQPSTLRNPDDDSSTRSCSITQSAKGTSFVAMNDAKFTRRAKEGSGLEGNEPITFPLRLVPSIVSAGCKTQGPIPCRPWGLTWEDSSCFALPPLRAPKSAAIFRFLLGTLGFMHCTESKSRGSPRLSAMRWREKDVDEKVEEGTGGMTCADPSLHRPECSFRFSSSCARSVLISLFCFLGSLVLS